MNDVNPQKPIQNHFTMDNSFLNWAYQQILIHTKLNSISKMQFLKALEGLIGRSVGRPHYV